jgi:hypothetical protein
VLEEEVAALRSRLKQSETDRVTLETRLSDLRRSMEAEVGHAQSQ